jgi:hypothetical protein
MYRIRWQAILDEGNKKLAQALKSKDMTMAHMMMEQGQRKII